MKTRIISGIVMGAIVAAILVVGFLWAPIVITLAVTALAIGAVYELLHNAAGIKSKASIIGAGVFTALFIFSMDGIVLELIAKILKDTVLFYSPGTEAVWQGKITIFLCVLYFIFAVFMVFKNNKEFDLGKIVSLCALPIPYAYAFSCLSGIINAQHGLFYLLLLFNFSSVCDMGAYFVGVTMGKHKLCPNLSPKKTVEGAIGGILSAIIVAIIIILCFGFKDKLVATLIVTVPFCILGMAGDLFASAIKRAVGLKDYGNLIPGHGGILDRVDSIIMIAPLLSIVISLGVI